MQHLTAWAHNDHSSRCALKLQETNIQQRTIARVEKIERNLLARTKLLVLQLLASGDQKKTTNHPDGNGGGSVTVQAVSVAEEDVKAGGQ